MTVVYVMIFVKQCEFLLLSDGQFCEHEQNEKLSPYTAFMGAEEAFSTSYHRVLTRKVDQEIFRFNWSATRNSIAVKKSSSRKIASRPQVESR